MRGRLGCACALLGLGACQLPVAQSEVAAVLVNSSAQSRAELRQAVSGLFGVPTIILADDAFTRSSELQIERAALRDASGARLPGRDDGRPETLGLVKRGDTCILVRARTGQRAVLGDTTCRAVKPAAPPSSDR